MRAGSGGATASGSGGSASGGSGSGTSGSGGSGSGGSSSMTGGSGGATGTGGGSGGTTLPPQPFEIDGRWTYLGPSDVPHDLTIDHGSMLYEDVDGMWSSKWTIKTYDNGLHHFQVTFDSGSGSYLPVGESMSGTYDRGSAFLTIQLAKGLSSYPPVQGAGSCTEADGTPIPECRLYVKLN